MEKRETPAKEKIILPKNLQREMIKFFLHTSIPRLAADKEQQQTPPNSEKNGSGKNG
ncbi:MAG: hypothetical protein FWE27_05590 [Defluviitaleaceae bacterium]|nr:hypothetical protein [Defluviitaleaceae bacterium]